MPKQTRGHVDPSGIPTNNRRMPARSSAKEEQPRTSTSDGKTSPPAPAHSSTSIQLEPQYNGSISQPEMTDSDEEAEQALRQAEQAEVDHFLELTRQKDEQRTISHGKQLEPPDDIDPDFARVPNAIPSLREIRSLQPRLIEHDALRREASRRIAQLDVGTRLRSRVGKASRARTDESSGLDTHEDVDIDLLLDQSLSSPHRLGSDQVSSDETEGRFLVGEASNAISKSAKLARVSRQSKASADPEAPELLTGLL